MSFLIKKSTEELEQFDREKLRRSLLAPGASEELVNHIINYVESNLDKFRTTEDIFVYALDQLQEKNPHIAARYNIKKAILQFGPTGFPFERFVSEIFKKLKYEIKLDQIIDGWCVNHEIDIVLKKDNEFSLVECKFHNLQNYRTDVRVALYTYARFLDIEETRKQRNEQASLTSSWIVTNTKFTYEALKYGNCKQMNLISWNYPKNKNLARLIDNYGLYPITAVVSLNTHQKKVLIGHGVFFCKDAGKHEGLLKSLGISEHNLNKIVRECELICQTAKHKIDFDI